MDKATKVKFWGKLENTAWIIAGVFNILMVLYCPKDYLDTELLNIWGLSDAALFTTIIFFNYMRNKASYMLEEKERRERRRRFYLDMKKGE